MTTLALIALAATAVWAWRRHRDHQTGAGASAARQARQLRTPLVRLATTLGIHTRAEQRAAQYTAGAAGERRTAQLLDPLRHEGWTILHDRALPGTRANVDHLAISPTGAVLMPDSKHWSARYPLTVRDGRLWHGEHDVTGRLRGLHHEQRTVSRVLGVPVTPIIAMHGAPLHGPSGQAATELEIDGVRIVPAQRLTTVMRATGHIPGQRLHDELAAHARRALPPHARK